ncbi:MAG: acyltransferase domain-containing protein [Ilumatobacteraceae bacterium]
MGRPWADHESWELVDEASAVADRDVARLLLDADADELKDTRNAQLTTFVSSLIVLDAVERLGVEPSFCAGHSLGEYTALTATGALGFDEGVRLVCERADAMHDAGHDNPGTMAAARPRRRPRRGGLPPLDSDVWVANFNAPGQVVIAVA